MYIFLVDPVVKERIIMIIKKHEDKKKSRDKKISRTSEKSLKLDEDVRKKHSSPNPSRKKEIVIETSVNTNTGGDQTNIHVDTQLYM